MGEVVDMGLNGSGYPRLVPPTLQTLATLNQAAAVQNTWYAILDTTTNVRLYYVIVQMDTLAEDIAVRITIDGQVFTGSQAAAVAGTPYYWYVRPNATSIGAVPVNTVYPMLYQGGGMLEGSSVKVECRKTTANGANNLKGATMYARW